MREAHDEDPLQSAVLANTKHGSFYPSFTESLSVQQLHARHLAKPWGCGLERGLCPHAQSLMEKMDIKQKTHRHTIPNCRLGA